MRMIRKILCVTDLSQISRNAEIASLRLAGIFNSEVTILSCGEYYSHIPNNYFDENIIQPQPDFPHTEEYLKFIEQRKLETIEHFKSISRIYNVNLPENIYYEVKLENEVTATIDAIEEKSYAYDLVVVGKQNNGFWERLLFGSPAIEICDECQISTLLMPVAEEWSTWLPKGIIVASSLTEQSTLAENFAAEIASKADCELSILHIIDTLNLHFDMNVTHVFPIDYIPSQVQTETIDEIKNQRNIEVNKIQQKLKEEFHLKHVNIHITFGRVGDEILNYIKKYQYKNLLVIGASGGSALKRFFLGSKISAIEEACTTPLLIIQKKHNQN
jgi:nucleotide-binding universal stress UspA family protein